MTDERKELKDRAKRDFNALSVSKRLDSLANSMREVHVRLLASLKGCGPKMHGYGLQLIDIYVEDSGGTRHNCAVYDDVEIIIERTFPGAGPDGGDEIITTRVDVVDLIALARLADLD